MKILVTGANGFVGKNLCEALKNIRDEKDKTRPSLSVTEIYEYDIDTERDNLDAWCAECDFVFNLAGVNRSQSEDEFTKGNVDFLSILLGILKSNKNFCPVMISSSIQASCIGRYDGIYGRTKKLAEDALFSYSEATGAKALVYRFPNVFGKWCRPNYNSVVATFCYNIANDLPIQISNRENELELVYIDDLVNEMLDALEGKEHRCDFSGFNCEMKNDGDFCAVPTTHKTTLGKLADMLMLISNQPKCLIMPEIPNNSFIKKLYSTYLSYLPKEKVSFQLKMNEDSRGSFTELLKTEKCGQFSVNITRPGNTKGQHWHNTKWEFFIVVSGNGLIRQRKIGTEEIMDFYVSGEKTEAVHMLPGYTHNIINLSETENLVTVMWANEQFDSNHPDTFFEKV